MSYVIFSQAKYYFLESVSIVLQKRVKSSNFLLKICNKFINNKQRKYGKSFFTIVKSFQYRPVIVRTPPLEGGRIWKSRKRGVGGGGWHFSYLIFSRFIIFTFRNYFTHSKIVLCIWRKIIFSYHRNFMKKGHSKLSRNESENIL